MSSTEPKDAGLRPARRTIVKGAAWAVPAVAVAAPAASAATSPCEPVFTAGPSSVKCCSGQLKSMKVDIIITDAAGCISAGEQICIKSVLPDTGNPSVGYTEMSPASGCVNEGGTVTVWLYDVSNCTVNLRIVYAVDGGPDQIGFVKSDNITDSTVCPIVPPNCPDDVCVDSTSTSVEEPAVEEPAEAPAEEEHTADTAEVTSAPDTASTDNN